MSGIKTALALGAVFVAFALTACRPYDKGDHHPPRAARSVEIAKEICEVNALAEEHRSIMSRVETLEGGVPERERDERWTILMQKLRDYRAEIDGSYRFVTANCKSYNMCMLANHFQEGQCDASRSSWMESHRRFNDLAVRLAELERHHRPWKGPKPCHGGGCDGPSWPPAPCRDRDCDVMGDVFSSNCCRDSHRRDRD
jgi:hypothetical protein